MCQQAEPVIAMKSYYAPPLICGGIKQCFCLTSDICLSDVCLTRTSGLTREQRGLGRLKIGIEVAHVTRDSNTTFNVKRSKCQGHQAASLTPALMRQADAAVIVGTY